jgi:XTP/dITP diphosphohydrolase
MPKHQSDTTIVLASNNPGKLREIQNLFSDLPYKIIPQQEFFVPEIVETGLTFIENAILKARNAAQYSKLPVIADDSGLEIDILNGEPGIHSARFAGAKATSSANIAKVLEHLKDVPESKRNACFYCIMVYLKHANDPVPIIAEGRMQGRILKQAQGTKGFGYDPIFYVPSHKCSAAELPLEIKNKLSHRAQALQKLLQQLKQYGF